MRYRLSGGRTAATICAAAFAVGLAPGRAAAQGAAHTARPDAGLFESFDRYAPSQDWVARGQGPGVSTYDVPDRPADTRIPNPLPTGNPGGHGFYVTAEALFLTQSWTLGNQVVAFRGLLDSRGRVTGTPGTLLGSGEVALTTRDLPRRSYQPGFTIGLGYKFEDGTNIFFNYTHLMQRDYHAGATLAPPFFRGSTNLADTFVTSAVFNFPPQFAGPLLKTPADVEDLSFFDFDNDPLLLPDQLIGSPGGNFYGIWNGASVQDIQFNQWYNAGQIGVRTPLFQTEYTRIYGLAGGQYNNFMERFKWRVVSNNINGEASARDAALYSNTLSQRMYGAFLGCGHEAYLGGGFAGAIDLSAAGLFNVVKERAKYELQSQEIQNKMSRDEISFVPSLAGNVNLLWHPIEGVQLRVGYSANMFFNTFNMEKPIGFNYSVIDPAYNDHIFRIIHGVNVGLGLFF